MSSNNHFNPWFLLGAAVVGLVSAASVFLIDQFRNEKRRHAVNHDLARMDGQLLTLRAELDNIKKQQNKSRPVKRPTVKRAASSSVLSTTSEDYTSVVDLDSSDPEFYDLSSEEDTDNRDSIQKALHEVDSVIEDESTHTILYNKLEDLNEKFPKNPEILWRLGRVLKYKIISTDNSYDKRVLIDQGIDFLETATELNPQSAQCHKWLAILIGLRGDLQPTKERILDGHLFREHIETALEIEPDDPVLHHLLGRFTYEIASLSWIEKKLAATLFAELPACTYEDALSHFLKAEEINSREWKENRLFIAKCELGIGNIESAIEWLDKAENAQNNEEEKVHQEVKTLLDKYKQS